MSSQIPLRSLDGVILTVDKKAIERSYLIKTMLEDLGIKEGEDTEPIPIQRVTATVLKKVIEWCEHHKDDPPAVDGEQSDSTSKRQIEISEWDQEFINVDQEMLFEIISAANYLDIKGLLDIGCKTMANTMKRKSAAEIRTMFHIKNDHTPEEEDRIRRENAWYEGSGSN